MMQEMDFSSLHEMYVDKNLLKSSLVLVGLGVLSPDRAKYRPWALTFFLGSPEANVSFFFKWGLLKIGSVKWNG